MIPEHTPEAAASQPDRTEGWVWHFGRGRGDKYHYYVTGFDLSLCGRHPWPPDAVLLPDDTSPANCTACRDALRTRKASAPTESLLELDFNAGASATRTTDRKPANEQ